jgi:hypothetical protein
VGAGTEAAVAAQIARSWDGIDQGDVAGAKPGPITHFLENPRPGSAPFVPFLPGSAMKDDGPTMVALPANGG